MNFVLTDNSHEPHSLHNVLGLGENITAYPTFFPWKNIAYIILFYQITNCEKGAVSNMCVHQPCDTLINLVKMFKHRHINHPSFVIPWDPSVLNLEMNLFQHLETFT